MSDAEDWESHSTWWGGEGGGGGGCTEQRWGQGDIEATLRPDIITL